MIAFLSLNTLSCSGRQLSLGLKTERMLGAVFLDRHTQEFSTMPREEPHWLYVDVHYQWHANKP